MEAAVMHDSAAFDAWCQHHLARVEAALDGWLALSVPDGFGRHAPENLMQAMRYAALDGGKRLRPLLVQAAFEAVHGDVGAGNEVANPANKSATPAGQAAALRAACAVELIHAYSLVHDDMPCMDNDVLRRGKPTVHVQYGEATALLAGDALQAFAFELLTPEVAVIDAATQAQLCGLLARVAGSAGMAGGQAIDLASVGRNLSESELREMHQLKTGRLLQCSVEMGALCAKASADALHSLRGYGQALGLAFQVVDDILDVTADSTTLGKTAGKDADAGKPTYVSVLGLAASQRYAQELLVQALDALRTSQLANPQALYALADMVVNRAS